jgi:capsular polysaccharide biosynthesis protein
LQITDYLKIFWKRRWLILIIAIIAVASSYGFSKMQPRVYQASVKLLAEPSKPDYGLDLFLRSRLSSYQQLLSTREMAQQVIDKGQLDISADQLLSNIHVQPLPDQSIVNLTIDDENPQRAQFIANTIADTFVQMNDEKNAALAEGELRVNVSKLDTPQVPSAPYKPSTKVNVLAGGVIGLVFAFLLAFAVEFLDTSLKSPEDVQRQLGLPVLGSIPVISGEKAKAHSHEASEPPGAKAKQRA